jgi:hypothetical protein
MKFWQRRTTIPRESQASVVLYTALFGSRDNSIHPDWEKVGYPIIYFSPQPVTSPPSAVWRQSPEWCDDPNRAAKVFKLLPHLFLPDYPRSVWFDANIEPHPEGISAWIGGDGLSSTFGLFTHPERDCIYEEGQVCIALGRDSPNIIQEQLSAYRAQEYPAHSGLFAGGFLVRAHLDPKVRAINCAWWDEVRRFSKRDQLSLPVVLSRHELVPQIIPGSYWQNGLFRYAAHAGG